jgi:hypothetical protein
MGWWACPREARGQRPCLDIRGAVGLWACGGVRVARPWEALLSATALRRSCPVLLP